MSESELERTKRERDGESGVRDLRVILLVALI